MQSTLIKKLILLALSLIGLSGLFNVTGFHLSNDFRVYFSEDNPELLAFEQFEKEFGSHDSIALLVKPKEIKKDFTWLMPSTLNQLGDWTETISHWPFVNRVHSLHNLPILFGKDDEVSQHPISYYIEQLDWVQHQLNKDKHWQGLLLSPDNQLTMIVAELNIDKTQSSQVKSIIQQAEIHVKEWRSAFPNYEFYLIGSVVSNITLERAVQQDLLTLVPISYLVITLCLLFFLRSIKATLLTLIVITLSIVFTFTVYSWFQLELTPVAGFVPSVVLTLAVADCVHYLSSYRHFYLEHRQTNSFSQNNLKLAANYANQKAFKVNLAPISITSFTTALGVLMLNLSDSPPYRDLGNMVAIGVIFAWGLSITLLPLFLAKSPIYFKAQQNTQHFAEKYTLWLNKYKRVVTSFIFLLIGFCIWGITQITISENWSKYFSKQFELAQAIETVKHHFKRLHRYELIVSSKQSNEDIHDPNFLTSLKGIQAYLEQHPKVMHVQSYGYLLQQMNRAFHNNDDAYNTVPLNRELAAQLQLLLQISDTNPDNSDSFYNFDNNAARISMLLAPMPSEELLEFEHELLQFTQANYPNYLVAISGLDHIFSHIAGRNIQSMLIGSFAALLIISILIGVILNSFYLGVLSLIPNLFPALIAYGIWGMTKGYIDLALSVVVCMSIGIVVDDTVHFISKYVYARQTLALSNHQAIVYALNIVGYALIVTTIILVLGFAAILFSPLIPTAATGALLCITLVSALLIDFTLVPLLLQFNSRQTAD